MVKIDLYTSNACSRCVDAKQRVRAAVDTLSSTGEQFELHFIDVVEHIDRAVALGILATPAIVIEGELIFSTLPTDKKLQTELAKYL